MIEYSITSGIPNMCVFVLYVYHEPLVRLFTYFIQCALTFIHSNVLNDVCIYTISWYNAV